MDVENMKKMINEAFEKEKKKKEIKNNVFMFVRDVTSYESGSAIYICGITDDRVTWENNRLDVIKNEIISGVSPYPINDLEEIRVVNVSMMAKNGDDIMCYNTFKKFPTLAQDMGIKKGIVSQADAIINSRGPYAGWYYNDDGTREKFIETIVPQLERAKKKRR